MQIGNLHVSLHCCLRLLRLADHAIPVLCLYIVWLLISPASLNYYSAIWLRIYIAILPPNTPRVSLSEIVAYKRWVSGDYSLLS